MRTQYEYVKGNIPKEVTYIYNDTKTKLSNFWSDLKVNGEYDSRGEHTKAFASDSKNAKKIQTGVSWASGGRYTQDKPTVSQDTRPNDPIVGYCICDLEIRAEGGRAYKVLSPDGFLFDLREDILLDILLTDGTNPDGYIKSPLAWAVVGSHMKLVRVGSPLWDAIKLNVKDKETPLIPKKDWVVGGIYRNRSGDHYVYLGRADMDEFHMLTHHNGPTYYTSQGYQSNITYSYKYTLKSNIHIWYPVKDEDDEKVKFLGDYENVLKRGEPYYVQLHDKINTYNYTTCNKPAAYTYQEYRKDQEEYDGLNIIQHCSFKDNKVIEKVGEVKLADNFIQLVSDGEAMHANMGYDIFVAKEIQRKIDHDAWVAKIASSNGGIHTNHYNKHYKVQEYGLYCLQYFVRPHKQTFINPAFRQEIVNVRDKWGKSFYPNWPLLS